MLRAGCWYVVSGAGDCFWKMQLMRLMQLKPGYRHPFQYSQFRREELIAHLWISHKSAMLYIGTSKMVTRRDLHASQFEPSNSEFTDAGEAVDAHEDTTLVSTNKSSRRRYRDRFCYLGLTKDTILLSKRLDAEYLTDFKVWLL